jgi:hypothetical protein
VLVEISSDGVSNFFLFVLTRGLTRSKNVNVSTFSEMSFLNGLTTFQTVDVIMPAWPAYLYVYPQYGRYLVALFTSMSSIQLTSVIA